MIAEKLSEIVGFNSEFKNSINLYLNLNKKNKIKSYIPTKSSVDILKRYLYSVEQNKFHSTLLIGPYGKGKSHLLLVLLAIISMKRNLENETVINELLNRIMRVDETTGAMINSIWKNKGRFLPVIIMSTHGDLNQAFLVALNDALKREGLSALTPDTFYSHALETIERWESTYQETYHEYLKLLHERNATEKDIKLGLVSCENKALEIFKEVYPELTAGSIFNPLAGSEVLPIYKSIADKLKEEHGYSGIYIIFDEFSKFIEGQDKNVSGYNMKLLQDMCELASESKDSQVFITMVAHKSIREYGKYLSIDTINSFTGIEGRLEEVLFVTSSKNNYELIENAIYKVVNAIERVPQSNKFFSEKVIEEYYNLPAFKTVFTRTDFEKTVVKGCYPLSPISAYILLNVSEKMAQNERTLFTFISKEEPYSMAKYVQEHPTKGGSEWIINADLIYDYFKNLFKKDITNEFVHNEWLNAEYALSQTDEYNQIKMIKTLAVMSIVNKVDELPINENYLVLAAGLPDGLSVLEQLESKKIIFKKGSNGCYYFKTRTGSALKSEIKKRKALKGENVNVGKVLSSISEIKYILPKQYNYEYSMTRYFRYEFMRDDEFLGINDSTIFFENENFCDGKIIALFSLDGIDKSELIKNKIKEYKDERLVVIYSGLKFTLVNQALEYEVIQEIKTDIQYLSENPVLTKEIPIFEEDIEEQILNYMDLEFGEGNNNKTFYYLVDKMQHKKAYNIGKIVDEICQRYYNKAISINNELINREYVTSSPIKKARKIIIESIMNKESDEMFLSGTSAEATIYRALMVGTGIKSGQLENNVKQTIEIFDQFLIDSGDSKQSLEVLISKLTVAPFAMRKGVIPVYLAYSISKRNEDIVIYFEKKEVPINAETIINMCESPEEYSIYISIEDILKEKYISKLSELFDVKNNSNLTDSRINNILICMQRWFRSLPQVTKNIRNHTDYLDSPLLSNALLKIKGLMQRLDVNPYEAIFKLIPESFNTKTDYELCIEQLDNLKNKLNDYYVWIENKVIKGTIEAFDRKEKEDLHHTLKNWYEGQSDMAKQGLHSYEITGLMSCIDDIKTFDESEIIQKVVKVISEIYIDSWNDNSYDEYIEKLNVVKKEVESITDVKAEGKLELLFVGNEGKPIQKFYNRVDESTGAIFRNIIEDTLEDFSDLSVNDKVAILLEAIEKVIG